MMGPAGMHNPVRKGRARAKAPGRVKGKVLEKAPGRDLAKDRAKVPDKVLAKDQVKAVAKDRVLERALAMAPARVKEKAPAAGAGSRQAAWQTGAVAKVGHRLPVNPSEPTACNNQPRAAEAP